MRFWIEYLEAISKVFLVIWDRKLDIEANNFDMLVVRIKEKKVIGIS